MADGQAPDAATILARALQLPPAEREAFLVSRCGGDSALLATVRMILAAREAAGAFSPSVAEVAAEDLAMRAKPPDTRDLARAARSSEVDGDRAGLGDGDGDDDGDFATLIEGPGTRIGPYTLLHQIGEGGFGRVFVAEQHRPVRRQVALKVIRLGMDTRSVVNRFEAERQALALMDHPNIAKVLDGGSTASGRPYFVMELVDGVPITRHCDTMKLGIPARLELFRRVCLAVQHAHQKGVIHRDIKPGNVLVAEHDGEAVPKVIDFGIAKATHARLTDRTIVTGRETFIGTPQYMSPEQADLAGADADVDTRTDIFALGILLYELLTGTTPLESARLRELSLAEMQRMICEVPTPRPSSRVSTLGERLPDVAGRRRVAPERLGQRLRGDLDWIVLKATEKERSRRYDSAAALAADIERHLRNQPVEAGPPTTRYRVQKFVQRNRRAVIAASVLTATLLLGLVGTTTFAVVASRRADHSLKVEEFLKGLFVASSPMVADADEAWATRLLRDAQTLFPPSAGDGDALGMANQVLLAFAERLQTAGDSERAISLVELVLDPTNGVVGTPDEAGVRMRLALILSEQGRHAAAQREARLAIERLSNTTPTSSLAARANAATVFHAGLAEASAEERDEHLAFLRQSSLLAREHGESSSHQLRIDSVLIAFLCATEDADKEPAQSELLRTSARVSKAAAQLFAANPAVQAQTLESILSRLRRARVPAAQLLPWADDALRVAGKLPTDHPLRQPIKDVAWLVYVDAADEAAKAPDEEATTARRERAVEILAEWLRFVDAEHGADHPSSVNAKYHLATELIARVGRHEDALRLLNELLVVVQQSSDDKVRAVRRSILDQRVMALDGLTPPGTAVATLALAEQAHRDRIEHARANLRDHALQIRYTLSYAKWCAKHGILANAKESLAEAVLVGSAGDGSPSQPTRDCAALLATITDVAEPTAPSVGPAWPSHR